jgi:hypothetical protein
VGTNVQQAEEGESQVSYEDDQDLIGDLAFKNLKLQRTLQLPLIFHAGGHLTDGMRKEWQDITGKKEMTTKVMCDAIRYTLGEED